MTFENSVVLEDWMFDLIVPLHKSKGERRVNVGIIEILACSAWLSKYMQIYLFTESVE